MLRIQAVSNSKIVAVAIFVSFVFAPFRGRRSSMSFRQAFPISLLHRPSKWDS